MGAGQFEKVGGTLYAFTFQTLEKTSVFVTETLDAICSCLSQAFDSVADLTIQLLGDATAFVVMMMMAFEVECLEPLGRCASRAFVGVGNLLRTPESVEVRRRGV